MPEKFDNLFGAAEQGEKKKGPIYKFKKTVAEKEGKRQEEFVSVDGIELPVNTEGAGTQFDESEFEDFALDGKTMEILRIYAKAIKLGQPPLIEGPTDIGKSKILEYLAFITNNFLIYQSFSGQTDVSELIGKYVPNTEDALKTFEKLLSSRNQGSLKQETMEIIKKAGTGEEIRGLTKDECRKIAELEGLSFDKIDWVWQDGTVPTAMEHNAGQGCWLYFDELGAAEPQILVKLNRIFSRGVRRIEITENGRREVIAGENFRLFATTNPPDYAGREPFEKDFLRRWVYQKVDNLTEKDFLARLDYVGKKTKTEFPVGKIDLSKCPEIDHVLNEIIAMFRKQAQEYLNKIPKDPGEQGFRLGDFSDALRVQEYLRVLQGDDLIETLKEAVEFYYLGKIKEDKMDSGKVNVRNKLKGILDTIVDMKKAKKEIKNRLKELKSPELIKEREIFVRDLAEMKMKARKLFEDLELTDSGVDPSERGDRAIGEINGRTPEGKEIRFELREQAKYWNKFYQGEGVEWAEAIPEDIKITFEQEKEMKRMIEELGFDKMIIIPEGLTGEAEFKEVVDKDGKTEIRLKKADERYIKLHAKMSVGYEETLQSDNYKTDGGLGASRDKRKGLRIILTKEVQTLGEDEIFRETKGKSAEDLEEGVFKEKQVTGFTESEYLVYQREYHKRTGKHLDDWQKENCWTWLPGSERPVCGRVPFALWDTDYDRVAFNSNAPASHYEDLGCRLVGSFKV